MKTLKIATTVLLISLFVSFRTHAQGVKYLANDTLSYIFKSDIFRFVSGTAHVGVEIPFSNNRYSLYAALMGTYYTNNKSDYTRQLSGPGLELQFRDYLGKYSGPTKFPFYFGFQFMGRHIKEDRKYDSYYTYNYETNENILNSGYTNHRSMNIYYGGIVMGYQEFIAQALSVDVFVGGGLRLTYYGGEDSPTRFTKMGDFDYSGIMPKAGIVIGILQR